MGLKRLNEMERIIQSGLKRGANIIYDFDTITLLLNLLDEEKGIQDRSKYNSAYYVKNKEKLDSRSKLWYANNKEKVQERRNKIKKP